VNLCNKSPMLPHICHPPIETSSQLLYQVIGLSISAVLLTVTRIMDDTSMVAYEGKIAADAVKVSNKDKSRRNIAVSTTSTSCGTCWPSMCNAASDRDRHSGRTEPGVSGGHGDGVAPAASFLCASLL
jgi:hypothetical protein